MKEHGVQILLSLCRVLTMHHKAINGSKAPHLLQQLSLRDSRQLEQCALYELAANSSALARFRCIFLVCSSEDGCVVRCHVAL
jgi:hypothetical protein